MKNLLKENGCGSFLSHPFSVYVILNYLIRLYLRNTFPIFSNAMSSCSFVCVAIRLKRISVSVGATAGDTTGFTKIPSSSRSRVIANVI